MVFTTLECKVQNDGDHQRRAQQRRTPPVVILGRLTGPHRMAPVDVDTYGVQQRQDGHEREDARDNERDPTWLVAKVEQRRGDRADVDRELQLFPRVSMFIFEHIFGHSDWKFVVSVLGGRGEAVTLEDSTYPT